MSSEKLLDDLLIDEEKLNEEVLADKLAPYVQIGSTSGDFISREEFHALNSARQTEVLLLYKKATKELGLAVEEVGTPSDISEVSGLNHNTIKGAVRKLDEQGITQNSDGEYSIPTYNFDAIQELIEEG